MTEQSGEESLVWFVTREMVTVWSCSWCCFSLTFLAPWSPVPPRFESFRCARRTLSWMADGRVCRLLATMDCNSGCRGRGRGEGVAPVSLSRSSSSGSAWSSTCTSSNSTCTCTVPSLRPTSGISVNKSRRGMTDRDTDTRFAGRTVR